MTVAPAISPCGSCPYRRDVPSGVWSADEYAKLPPYDGETWEQPSGLFLCHQQDGRLCAGWVGCHDMDESLAVRFGAATGALVAGAAVRERRRGRSARTRGRRAARRAGGQDDPATRPEAGGTIKTVKTTYYSWLGDDGTYSGLARARHLSGGGTEWAFVYAAVKGWALKQELFGLLLDGDIYFEKIDQATAEGLAARYGVDLDAEAEWRWDDENRQIVSLADGTVAPTQLVAAGAEDDFDFDREAAKLGWKKEPVESGVWLIGSPGELAAVKKALGR